MPLRVATWNINSVRLRLPLVLRYLEDRKPDVLCLQETKCCDDQFPRRAFTEAGYPYLAIRGQKGYHGVAIVSRVPLLDIKPINFCRKNDCRHIAVLITTSTKKIRIHNFYVPAGGDEPDPIQNPKFKHKLDFLEEMHSLTADSSEGRSSLLVGDLNIAPLENDVWSHKQLLKIVSHTPLETSKLLNLAQQGGWVDLIRTKCPEPEKLFTWWSYRAKDWLASNRGRRLDHIWASSDLVKDLQSIEIFTTARGWPQPSDHVPVAVTLNLTP